MKRVIAGVLVVCAMACAAETVSFPVLTVESAGRSVTTTFGNRTTTTHYGANGASAGTTTQYNVGR